VGYRERMMMVPRVSTHAGLPQELVMRYAPELVNGNEVALGLVFSSDLAQRNAPSAIP
jgi:hypothetical protein